MAGELTILPPVGVGAEGVEQQQGLHPEPQPHTETRGLLLVLLRSPQGLGRAMLLTLVMVVDLRLLLGAEAVRVRAGAEGGGVARVVEGRLRRGRAAVKGGAEGEAGAQLRGSCRSFSVSCNSLSSCGHSRTDVGRARARQKLRARCYFVRANKPLAQGQSAFEMLTTDYTCHRDQPWLQTQSDTASIAMRSCQILSTCEASTQGAIQTVISLP